LNPASFFRSSPLARFPLISNWACADMVVNKQEDRFCLFKTLSLTEKFSFDIIFSVEGSGGLSYET
jgi:hypothetical protein